MNVPSPGGDRHTGFSANGGGDAKFQERQGAAAVALLVYQKFGLAMLRRSWFNLDLIWAIALVTTGFVASLV